MSQYTVDFDDDGDPTFYTPHGTPMTMHQVRDKLNEAMEPLRVVDIYRKDDDASMNTLLRVVLKQGVMRIHSEVAVSPFMLAKDFNGGVTKDFVCHSVAKGVAERFFNDVKYQMEKTWPMVKGMPASADNQ